MKNFKCKKIFYGIKISIINRIKIDFDSKIWCNIVEHTGLDTTGMDLTKTEIKFQMPAGDVTFKATYLANIKNNGLKIVFHKKICYND